MPSGLVVVDTCDCCKERKQKYTKLFGRKEGCSININSINNSRCFMKRNARYYALGEKVCKHRRCAREAAYPTLHNRLKQP